ncbi:MAG: alpha/beta fold hydrolase [Acetobacteraceae bacterium]
MAAGGRTAALPADGRPPRIVVLALHGFNDSRDTWALSAPVFAAHDAAVFAPDQRGFGGAPDRGGWPGVQHLVSDADAMARDLRRRFPAARLFVMGISMGGAVVMDLAASPTPPPVDGYVMLAPAVWGREEQGAALSAALWAVNGVAPGYHITGNEVPTVVHASDNRAALIALGEDPLTILTTKVSTLKGLVDLMDSAQAAAPHVRGPALVAYGAHDDLVPPSAMSKAWTNLPPGTRLALYPNGYHLLMSDLNRLAVINDVLAWMQSPDALLPSGADIAAAAWRTSHHPGGGFAF